MFNIIIKWIISNRFIFFSVRCVWSPVAMCDHHQLNARKKRKTNRNVCLCVSPAFAPLQFEINNKIINWSYLQLLLVVSVSIGCAATIDPVRLCVCATDRHNQTMFKWKSNILLQIECHRTIWEWFLSRSHINHHTYSFHSQAGYESRCICNFVN